MTSSKNSSTVPSLISSEDTTGTASHFFGFPLQLTFVPTVQGISTPTCISEIILTSAPQPLETGDSGQHAPKCDEKADPFLVTWVGPDDPDNPRNWSNRRRWVVTLVVSLFTFIRYAMSSLQCLVD